jgi:hypothetical protein
MKQNVYSTVILPPLVFPGQTHQLTRQGQKKRFIKMFPGAESESRKLFVRVVVLDHLAHCLDGLKSIHNKLFYV